MPQTNKLIIILTAVLMLTAHAANNYAAPKADSLKQILHQTHADTIRLKIMMKIAKAYQKHSTDSAIAWFNKSLHLVEQYNESNAKMMGYKAEILQRKAWSEGIYLGKYDTALALTEKAIHLYNQINDTTIDIDFNKAKCYNIKGSIFFYKGAYEKAIENYQLAIELNEKAESLEIEATAYLNIGNIHVRQNNYERAVDYYKKSLEIKKQLNDKDGIANIYNNIGSIFYKKQKLDKAISYLKKSLAIRKAQNDKKAIAKSYNNIGVVYKQKGNLEKAIDYYNRSLPMKRQIGDQHGTVMLYINISGLYETLAEKSEKTLHRIKHLRKAEHYALLAFNLAEKIDAIPRINQAAINLKQIYQKLHQPVRALQYADIYITTQDSLYNKEQAKALAAMEAKFQSKQKQQEIEKQKIMLAAEKAEVKKKNIQRNAFIAGFVLMILLSFFIYRHYRQKQKANIIINEKNNILEQANAEIAAQRDEIESQRDEIERQRDKVTIQKEQIEEKNRIITKKNADITDSIEYASHIQQALLPSHKTMAKLFADYFIFFRPRDIVSGDFYWSTNIEGKTILATADCTGHGVPGAFMSLLGISFLNEIVGKNRETDPGKILNQLREHVIAALKQKDKDIRKIATKDGIDIALCTIDRDQQVIKYAGARNSLYIIKKQNPQEQQAIRNNTNTDLFADNIYDANHIFKEIKANRMPVGIHVKQKKFDTHTIPIEEDMRLYTFSDGYMDQFGGSDHRKFMSRAFKKLIFSMYQQPMEKQKQLLNTQIESWMQEAGETQGDDMVIVGIKI